MIIAQEEIFGPVVSVIEVASLEEAIEVNNGVKFGLSSSIFSQDVNTIFRAQRDLDTGIVYVNAAQQVLKFICHLAAQKGLVMDTVIQV